MPLFNAASPLSQQDLQTFRTALDRLQGNMLKSHGRDTAHHIFVTFTGDAGAVRQFLAAMGVRHATSANEQAAQTARHKAGQPDELLTQVLLSAAGYHYLGLDTAGFDPLFRTGMKSAASRLADPAPGNWETSFRDTLHALIVVASDDREVLEHRSGEIRGALAEIARVHVEKGKAIKNADKRVIEHFGYIDGRSQPLLFADDVAAEPRQNWDPSAGPALILVKDPLGSGDDDCGSYFVFRKLEQNVRGFKLREQALADALGLTGDDRELAGAMVVGRFEDGTPVAVRNSPAPRNPDGSAAPIDNDFAYPAADRDGNRCPFSSHIRKTNPRGDTKTFFGASFEQERGRRIVRRGITYGDQNGPAENPEENPAGGVGLLFQCCNRNLADQFEFMQKSWVNNPAFVQNKPGEDPVIGQSKSPFEPGKWPAPWDSANRRDFDFHNFVHLMGGEYFFCPSIPFLAGLAG